MLKKNKILILALAFMSLSAMVANAQATSGQCGDNLYWSFNSSTRELTITGTGDMYDYTSASGSRAPWYSYRTSITVSLPDGITSIGNYAFYQCTGLTSIVIPNTVTSIGINAFRSCTGLTSISIPNSVTSIGIHAFSGCTGLTSITIHENVESIGGSSFQGCTSLHTVNFNAINCTMWDGRDTYRDATGTITVGNVFNGCTAFTTLNIGNQVTNIPGIAFYFTNITSVTIPASVENIGNGAFGSCINLNTVTIGEGVKTIGEEAFADCRGLTKIINRTVTPLNINANIFQRVNNKSTIALLVPSASVTAYRAAMVWRDFNVAGIVPVTGVSLNKTTLAIAVGEAETLTATMLPADASVNNVTWTSSNPAVAVVTTQGMVLALAPGTAIITATTQEGGYTAACSLTVSGSVCGSGTPIASGVSGTAIWTLCADGTLTINGYEMANNTPFTAYKDVITTVVIGESVTRVGDLAFENCTALTTVYFNAVNCSYTGSYTATPVAPGSPDMSLVDNRAFKGCTNISNVYFGSKVKIIPAEIFRSCSGLTSVILPESVKSILANAFINTSLTSVTLPESLTTIGESAFASNNNLTTLNFNAVNCSSPNNVFVYCSNLTAINFGNKVQSIPHAFCISYSTNNSITTLTIPESVTAIAMNTFSYFTALTTVYFNAVHCTSTSAAFGNSVRDVYFGNEVKVIPRVFRNCTGLYSVTMGNSVTEIADNAFVGCSNLTLINIGSNVESIGYYAFSNCTWLESITLPQSLTTIGAYAFSGCSRLTDIALPQNVTSMGNRAFENCTGLTSITSSAVTPPTLGVNVFIGVPANIPVYVICDYLTAYQSATGWNAFTNYQCVAIPVTDISDITVPEEEGITVVPEDVSARIAWFVNPDATKYTLVIYEDESCTNIVCLLELDAAGRLTGISFPQMRAQSTDAQEVLGIKVNNLSQNTTYFYTMQAFNGNDTVIDTKEGSFKTTGNGTGVVETLRATSLPEIVGYYSLSGQKLPREPQSGIYIIRYDNGTAEKVKR